MSSFVNRVFFVTLSRHSAGRQISGHGGTKKNQILFFVSSWPLMYLVAQMLLKAIRRSAAAVLLYVPSICSVSMSGQRYPQHSASRANVAPVAPTSRSRARDVLSGAERFSRARPRLAVRRFPLR